MGESSQTCHATPAELLRLKQEYLLPCVYHFYKDPPHIVASRDCWLIDHAGKHYLDCYSGVTVTSAGHCNPAIIEPTIEQMRTLDHTTTIYLTEPVLRLAERLAQIVPGNLKRSFFCASGSEAVEGALLTAALHTGRSGIVAATDSLHGRTRWAINATGLEMWRTDPNPLSDVHHVPFNDLDALAHALRQGRHEIAAVILEPIQGNGGIVVPDDDYLPAAQRLCHEYDVLSILDEVQTGFGRTGRWFACQHWKVVPDILVVSKALGNGCPIAAFMTTDAIAASYTRPGASTYGGNPVCATAALATLDYHARHGLAERSHELGKRLMLGLARLAGSHQFFKPPRGLGLMIGAELVDRGGRPDAAALDRLLEQLKDVGFLCGKTGPNRNVLTLMPPLTIDRDQIDSLLSALDDGLSMLETDG